MKKIFLLALLLLFVPLLASCGTNEEGVIRNNMSDLRINYFEGIGTYFSATMSCGYREEVFDYNGICTKPVECGVITIRYFETHNYYSITAIINIDGNEREVNLQRSPYEDMYMVDIETLLTKDNCVSIHLKNQTEIVDLIEISSGWKIDHKKAISIGTKHYEKEIKSITQNNKVLGEAYLKIVANDKFDKKFWYFSIIDTKNNVFFCLIDVNGGNVISNLSN